MTNGIKNVLLIAVVSSVVFVALDSVKHRIPSDLRDAVSDSAALGRDPGYSLKNVAPYAGDFTAPQNTPAPDPAVKDGKSDKDVVISETFSDKKLSDRSAYIRDNEGDNDVVISGIFPDKSRAEKAMSEEESRLKTGGSTILFSCLLRETAGGVFYVIRLAPSSTAAIQTDVRSDKSEEAYLTAIKEDAAGIENECRNTLGKKRS